MPDGDAVAARECEVLVVGAGPTGLTAALELRRLGVPATLVDRLPAPHRQTRATGVVPWSLELLEAAGAADPIAAEAVHATGSDLLTADGTLVAGYHLDRIPSRYRWFAALPQWRTEAVLTERLRAYGGAVDRGVAVTALAERDDHVEVTARTAAGVEQWRAGWVVCATGSDPTVRHALHEQLEGGEYPHRYSVADVRADVGLEPERSAVAAGPGGAVAFFALPDGRRLVVCDEGGPEGSDPPDLAAVRRMLAARLTMPWTVDDLTWSATFTIHHRVVPRMADGRVLLAGDAAHMSSLFGGFGMNGGLADAVDLAWKLAMVHHGTGRPALVGTYGPERRSDAVHRVAVADAAHDAVSAAVGEHPVPLDPAAMPSDPDAVALTRAMLDVHYPAGDGILPGTGPHAAGTRYPDPGRVRRSARYQLVVGPGAQVPDGFVRRWASAVGEPDPVATEAAGSATLLRPDGVVAWSAAAPDPGDWAALDDRLARILVPG